MAKALMIFGNPQSSAVTAKGAGVSTRYFACGNAPLVLESTLANTQITYRMAGTFSKGTVLIDTNTFDSDSFFTLQVNGADTAITFAAGPGTTGLVADTTHTVTIAAGDLVNWKVVVTGEFAGGTLSLTGGSVLFQATTATDTVVRHAAMNFAQMVNAGTWYVALCDNSLTTNNTTEARAKIDLNSAGTLTNLMVYVSQWTNTASFTAAVTLMLNGSAQTLTVSPNATGVFEDTAHPITIAADDDAYLKIVTTGTGSITLEVASVEWVSTNKKYHILFGCTGVGYTQLGGLERLSAIGGGGILGGTVDDNYKLPMRHAATVSHSTAHANPNTLTSFPDLGPGCQIYVEQNASNTAIVTSIGEGVTGEVEDATHSVAFVATDYIDWLVDCGSTAGSITIRTMGLLIENTDPTGAVKDVIGRGVIPWAR